VELDLSLSSTVRKPYSKNGSLRFYPSLTLS